jgi:gamma-glutamylcyclotransferase (GGCT)/AIG2-like uncharacterized protein YtfP
MQSSLFVYGTLRSSYRNRWAKALRAASRHYEQAWTRGTLDLSGRYPVLQPGDGNLIRGELYHLRNQAVLGLLDAYEGPSYQRVEIPVWTKRAGKRRAWCYVGSDWFRSRARAAGPAGV